VRDHRQLPPNSRLSEARRRLLSPSGSGRPMSRQELAEAVNAYLWKEHSHEASLDGNYIGKLERGEHRWPGDLYREAFRAVLKTTSDAELGFYIIRTVSGQSDGSVIAASQDHGGRESTDGSSTALLAVLRSALSDYRPFTDTDGGSQPLASVEAAAVRVHQAYQRADYDGAARMLPGLIHDAHVSVIGSRGDQRQRALRVQAVTYIAASKLASKAGDGQLAWLAADRAAVAAQLVEATALSAVAAYQVACAFLQFPARRSDAEDLVVATAEGLARHASRAGADLVSARGRCYYSPR
jgi:hypothetical protein